MEMKLRDFCYSQEFKSEHYFTLSSLSYAQSWWRQSKYTK